MCERIGRECGRERERERERENIHNHYLLIAHLRDLKWNGETWKTIKTVFIIYFLLCDLQSLVMRVFYRLNGIFSPAILLYFLSRYCCQSLTPCRLYLPPVSFSLSLSFALSPFLRSSWYPRNIISMLFSRKYQLMRFRVMSDCNGNTFYVIFYYSWMALKKMHCICLLLSANIQPTTTANVWSVHCKRCWEKWNENDREKETENQTTEITFTQPLQT